MKGTRETMNKLARYITNPWRIYLLATSRGLTKWVPNEAHLKMAYRASMGRRVNLDNPQTFNEKLQWLKLHDRNPLYTTLVDKYRVKQWVAERIGERYVTPTYGAWERVEDIDLSSLPERFVLKTNHDCGGIAICRDRATFDFEAAKRKLAKHLRKNYYWGCREWPYKDVKPLVFAEEYLEAERPDGDMIDYKIVDFGGEARGELARKGRPQSVGSCEMTDYKFYSFDGEPRYLYVSQGLENHETARISFLRMDWSFAPFSRPDYSSFEELPEKPGCYDEMVVLARRLAEGIPFVRADLFVYQGHPRFSEMTFSPCGGFMPFDPPEWDGSLGGLVDLSVSYGLCQRGVAP